MVVLPAPRSPHTPTNAPAGILNDTFFSIFLRIPWYLFVFVFVLQ
jgi:hypothetical protein